VTNPVGTACAVNCYTCHVNVWQGDVSPADGQVLLTAYADSAAGAACPSKVDPCPNKTAEVAKRLDRVPAVVGDLKPLLARLAAIEAKVKVMM
jgi:hypothetical protein